MILLFAIATALYVFAPQIGEAVPQLADPMSVYVALVDQLRAWLDVQIAALLALVNGMGAEAPATGSS
mgnify:CR=1 FL=1